MVATAVLPLLQVPPLPLVVNVVVLPVQTEVNPLIVPALGVGTTVTGAVATAVPQAVTTL